MEKTQYKEVSWLEFEILDMSRWFGIRWIIQVCVGECYDNLSISVYVGGSVKYHLSGLWVQYIRKFWNRDFNSPTEVYTILFKVLFGKFYILHLYNPNEIAIWKTCTARCSFC
jgi:hypothetical protein